MLKSFTPLSTFYDGNEISVTDLEQLRNNTQILQNIVNRSEPVFSIGRKLKGWEGRWSPGSIFWKGGFMYRIGMETARFVFTSIAEAGNNGARVKILFDVNGVITEEYNQAIVNESKNINITINNRSWNDHTVVYVTAYIFGNTSVVEPTNCTAYFSDAYCFPLTLQTSYTTSPTVTDINASTLNAIANAQNWLAQRLALVPYTPIMAYRYWQGTAQSGKEVKIFYGTVSVSNFNNKLKGNVSLTTWNQQTYFRVRVNGQNIDYGPYTENQTANIPIDIDLSALGCVANTDYIVELSEVCVVGNPESYRNTRNTRINTGLFYLAADTYSNTTLPTVPTPLELLEFSDLKSYLQTLSTINNNVKTRIDNQTKIFNRARMFRDRFGISKDQDEYWKTEMYIRNMRRGDILEVRGKGLRLAAGPIDPKITADNEKWEYTYKYEEDITDGDGYQTKFIYLDQYPWITYGTPYYVLGSEIQFVNEYLYDTGF